MVLTLKIGDKVIGEMKKNSGNKLPNLPLLFIKEEDG